MVPASGRYWQVEGLKDGMKRSRSLWDQELTHLEPLTANPALYYAHGPGSGDVIVLHNDISFERGGKTFKAAISVGADQADYEAATAEFRNELLLMLALTGLFLALASGLQIYVGLRPLVNVRRAVASVRQGLSRHIDDSGPEEVRPLIIEINTLLDGERAAVERARARASDLAHGLKTPLTILAQIGETLESVGDEDRARRIHEQVAAIRARTDRQLALARVGGRGATTIDAQELSGRILRVVEPIAASRNISVANLIPDACGVQADATDFAEAVGNLVDNAIIHAKTRVELTGAMTEDGIRITVSDDGAGIDAKDRIIALERGQRLDESGNGSGLGLAITADIMRAYGGSILLSNSSMGGLAAHLDWPFEQRKMSHDSQD